MVLTSSTPLLADSNPRRDSEDSDRAAQAEDDALYHQQSSSSTNPSSWLTRPWALRLREIFLFLWATTATAAFVIILVVVQHRQQTNVAPDHPKLNTPPPSFPKRNLVFMVSDGMGPTTLSLTRSFRQHIHNLPINDTLTLDKHFWGTSRTRSSSSLVTDSAAGATAFSCGLKSYNGAISVLPDADKSPCGSVMEAAKMAGYRTGLVVTTDITDATPAVFVSHVKSRAEEEEIARQEVGEGKLGRMVDLMLGGGRCWFLPGGDDEKVGEASCRSDGLDVRKLAEEKFGWRWMEGKKGFEEWWKGKGKLELPAMGLFADHDIPFEIDRRLRTDEFPSLSEMAQAALEAMAKATEESDRGFFLMIEGSLIDHCGHVNDPACQVHETLEYDKTFKLVLDFLENSGVESVLVSTSDHETGGLSTAWQSPAAPLPVYNWYPSVLAKANASTSFLSHQLRQHIDSLSSSTSTSSSLADLKAWINTQLLIPGLGITDARDSELNHLATNPESATNTLSQMISRRARVGWSTRGHSAVDVNIYAAGGSGSGMKSGVEELDVLRGNVENTDVGVFLRDWLGVDVEEVTRMLREGSEKEEVEVIEGVDEGEERGDMDAENRW